MKTVNYTLGLGILALLTVWSCTVEEMETPRQAVLVDPLPAAQSYYDLEKPKQGNLYGRIQSDLEVFPYWEGAKSYSEGQILIVPAHRKVKATYGQGYLRRLVFQLDEAGQVIRGGMLEMAGKDGAFLLENEEVLIEGFLSGVKSSQLTYLWSDFGSNPLDAIQSNGQKVERSVDRLLNSRRGLENFSTENCIDWYWVYSISGVVIYEEYSHTTCPGEGCSSGLRTNSQDACLDEGTPSGGGGAGNDFEGIDCSSFKFSNVNSSWREAGVSRVRFNVVYLDGSRRENKTIEIPRPIYFGLPTAVHSNPFEAAEFTAGAVQRASDLAHNLVMQNPGILDYTLQIRFMEFLQAQMSIYGGTAGFYPSNGFSGMVTQADYSWFGNGNCD